jgi:hypothetical protein
MTYQDDAWAAIKDADNDLKKAVLSIQYDGSKPLVGYVILMGLQTIARRKRANRRRELRFNLQPEFVHRGANGSVTLTAKAKQRLLSHAKELYGDDGWVIGSVNISNFTKEQLLAQSEAERKSAEGSLRNADFYAALAHPMQPGQTVKEYWTPEKAKRLRGD